MSIESKLKDMILERYHSIREFSNTVDMPYTTIDSILKRGIANSSVSNIISICKELQISADALADGDIQPVRDLHKSLHVDGYDIYKKIHELNLNTERLGELYEYAKYLSIKP